MKRIGQIEITAFVIIGLIVVIGGVAYNAYNVSVKERYVGDLNTRWVYDITKCDIPPSKGVQFSSLEQAHKAGFQNAPNCI